MFDSGIRRLVAVAILTVAAGLSGCYSSNPDENETSALAPTCQGQQDCEASDNARQIRDEVDYQTEPALGYLASPPGLLPIPLTSRNTSAN